MDNKIDQKKYLQKYLNPKPKKKKSHKKVANAEKRVQIIDDDIDFSQIMPVNSSEYELYGEDAPQIAGIIDERPLDVQLKEKFKFNTQWKPIGNTDELISSLTKKDKDVRRENVKVNSSKTSRNQSDDDYSPKRRENNSSDDLDIPRKKSRFENEYKTKNNLIKNRKSSNDSNDDIEVPRRKIKSEHEKNSSKSLHKDVSLSSEHSRFKKSESDEDLELPRRKIKTENEEISSKSNKSSDDYSPKRRDKHNFDFRKDLEVPRRKSRFDQPSTSLESKRNKLNDYSPKRYNYSKTKDAQIKIKTEPSNDEPNSTQSKNIVTFNIRNPDAKEKQEKADRLKIQQEKYATWGKGLKQVEDRQEKLLNDAHEMSKPLARYADDQDLEDYLRDQEREGDPMLDYIRKENKNNNNKMSTSKVLKPKYEGAFMPNRFGIPPGHRWDGVDRSNGYEAQWFEVINKKKILEEEAYKWSTDDM